MIAGRLLKGAVQTKFKLFEDRQDKEPFLIQMHYRCVLQDFLVAHPQYPPEKVVEALDILAANNHIYKYDSVDVYSTTCVCTKQGEQADNEGYYTRKVIKFWLPIVPIIKNFLNKK
ncbi:MAG: hypothetical protein ICV84_00080 [Flavisolibacter sp.]|nr:hypothetical protein [Flavisolibacter sp.]